MINGWVWASWYEAQLSSTNTIMMRGCDKGKLCPPMWAVAAGASVVGSGYGKIYLSNKKRLIFLYLDWSQILMIW